ARGARGRVHRRARGRRAARRRRRPRLSEPRQPARARRRAGARRGRHVPRRVEGRRDRPRRRARARPGPAGGAGGERRRRARPRRGPPRPRPRAGAGLMGAGRRWDPLPLGEPGGLPYSKGLMARALVAAGVQIEPAYLVAMRIEADLAARGERTADLGRIEELAVEALGLPILVLVGGATGTGKSSVATEVAHRIGITRVTSTDFVRQTLRAFFSYASMPSVHSSSFEGDPALPGFVDQTRNVLVG